MLVIQDLHVAADMCIVFRELDTLQLPRLVKLKLTAYSPEDSTLDMQALVGAPWFTQLRSLTLFNVQLDAAGLRPLSGLQLPALEELSVDIPDKYADEPLWDDELPPVHLPNLRRLELNHSESMSMVFPLSAVAALLAAQQGNGSESSLEVLKIYDDPGHEGVTLLMSCLVGLPLHRLRHISFQFDNFSDDALAHLVAAPWLSSLVELHVNFSKDYELLSEAFGGDIQAWGAFAAAPLGVLRSLRLRCPNLAPEAAALLGNAPWLAGLTEFVLEGPRSEVSEALQGTDGYQALLRSGACRVDVCVCDHIAGNEVLPDDWIFDELDEADDLVDDE